MLRRVESTRVQHWVVPLFDPTMILFNAPVEESAAAIVNFVAQRLPNRTRVRIMSIAGYLLRCSLYNSESATEEALGCAISRVALSIESIRSPSRSIAR
jgi:hypothetical protein